MYSGELDLKIRLNVSFALGDAGAALATIANKHAAPKKKQIRRRLVFIA